MPKKLRRLKINEVSAVDAAANPGAAIMLVKRDDPGTVTFQKGAESWTLPADLDILPALIAACPAWGIEIVSPPAADEVEGPLVKRGARGLPASPAPAPAPIREQPMQTAIYKRREIVELAKRFDATGEMPVEIQKRDIYEAMVKGAAKIRAPGESEAQAFSRYITSWADGASLFRLHKNASGSDVPPTPTFTSSFEALEHEKAQARKNTEAANRDRARRVESTIQEQIGALMLAGMSEAAARAHVERSPKIRAMRSASNIYRT